MPTQVLLPKVDNDSTEAKIVRWLVKEDSPVKKGDLIFEIETDKAVVEVDAPAAGTIAALVAPDGGMAAVGSAVAWIWGKDEDRSQALPATAPVNAVSTPASAPASDSHAQATRNTPGEQRGREPAPMPASRASETTSSAKLVPATPLARRLARERGVDLRLLQGTGPRGRIQSHDIPGGSAAAARANVQMPKPSSARLHREWLRAGEGDPIVLVHGFGSDLAIWRPLIAGIATANPVLALDLPVHGGSVSVEGCSFEEMVDLVEDALTDEGIRRAHLVGHSLGGAVVGALSGRTAIETRSLVLMSSAGLGPDINGAFLAGFVRARNEESLAPWMRLLVADSSLMSPVFVKATARARAVPGMAEMAQRMADRLFPDGTQSFSIRETLRATSCPVKLIFGAEDRIIPATHARGLPGSVAVHCFANVGHVPYMEIRAEVGRLVSEAIRSAC